MPGASGAPAGSGSGSAVIRAYHSCCSGGSGRAGLTPERATHLLLFYLGSDAYRPLVRDFGWTHEEWVDWTVATIADQVFAAR